MRIRSRRKLDEPEPGFLLTGRNLLELRNLDVLESEIADGKRRSAGIDAALGQKLLVLRFLIGASAPSRDVRRRGDATFHVRGVPTLADEHQPREPVRYLPFRQSVRMRVEPVHPARVIGCDHVAVADVAVLQPPQRRSGIERAGISGRIRGSAVSVARAAA